MGSAKIMAASRLNGRSPLNKRHLAVTWCDSPKTFTFGPVGIASSCTWPSHSRAVMRRLQVGRTAPDHAAMSLVIHLQPTPVSHKLRTCSCICMLFSPASLPRMCARSKHRNRASRVRRLRWATSTLTITRRTTYNTTLPRCTSLAPKHVLSSLTYR